MSYYSEKHYKSDDSFLLPHYLMFYKKGDEILDVGCSTGNLCALDRENIVGIDTDRDAILVGMKNRLKVSHYDGKKIPFSDGSFKNVHSKNVLEHIKDTLSAMKEYHRVLKKGGKITLITDQYTHDFWDDYTHVRPFSKKSLYQLAFDSGFKEIRISNFPSKGVPFVGILLKKGIISGKTAKKTYINWSNLFDKKAILLEAWK